MRYPLAVQTSASDAPVLPPVYSTTVSPGTSRPSRSARSITARAMRSFMLPVGFSHSSFTSMAAYPEGTTLVRRTMEVLPIASRTFMPRVLRARDGAEGTGLWSVDAMPASRCAAARTRRRGDGRSVVGGRETAGRLEQDAAQLGVPRGVGEVVRGEIVDADDPILGIEDDHVTPRNVPRIPDVECRRVLEPRKGPALADDAVVRVLTDLVHAEEPDRLRGGDGVDVALHLVEEPELGSAIRSGRVTEVPGGHLSHLGARRNRLPGGRGVRVHVEQVEIGRDRLGRQ